MRIRRSRSGRWRRTRRSGLVGVYLALLGIWGGLTYDTFGLWQARQIAAQQRFLAELVAHKPQTPTPAMLAVALPTIPPATTVLPTIPVPPTPTDVPPQKLHPKTGRYIAAWLPTSFDADQARASFDANKDILDEVSPFWYKTNPQTGELVPEVGARDAALVQAAHDADVLVLPTIHNNTSDGIGMVLPLLQNPKLRAAHVALLVDEVMQHNFDGIDIDYESLPGSVRADYSAFMQQLSDALHAKNKLLTVAVHAKTTDDGGLGGFQDWKLLGQICDRVRVMTYDYSWRGGGPGPIAPLQWVSQVGEYARAVVPPAKLQLGVPFYAYDWGDGEPEAEPKTWLDVQRVIDTYGPAVNFREKDADGPIQESWFAYRDGNRIRTVWFADSRALAAKLQLVQQQDLGGVAIWRLGSEDPQNWVVIRKQMSDNPQVIQQIMNTYLPEH